MLRSDSEKNIQPLDSKNIPAGSSLYPAIPAENMASHTDSEKQIEPNETATDKIHSIESSKIYSTKKLETNFEPTTFSKSCLDLLAHVKKVYNLDDKTDPTKLDELSKELSILITGIIRQHTPGPSDFYNVMQTLIKQSKDNTEVFSLFFRKFASKLPTSVLSGYPHYLCDAYQEGSLDAFRTMISAYTAHWDIDTRKKWADHLNKNYRNQPEKLNYLTQINLVEEVTLLTKEPKDDHLENLIEKFKLNIRQFIKNRGVDYRSRNILHIVIEKNFLHLTTLLLQLLKEAVLRGDITEAEHKAIINQQDFDGNTILHVAATMPINTGLLSRRKKQAEDKRKLMIERLIDNGANPDIANFFDKTPHGIYQGNHDQIKSILKPTPIINEEFKLQRRDSTEIMPRLAPSSKIPMEEMYKSFIQSYKNLYAFKITQQQYDQECFDLITYFIARTNSENGQEAEQALTYLRKFIKDASNMSLYLPQNASGKTLFAETIFTKALTTGSAEAFRLVTLRYPLRNRALLFNESLADYRVYITNQISREEKNKPTSDAEKLSLVEKKLSAIPNLPIKNIYLSSFELDLIDVSSPIVTADKISEAVTTRLEYEIPPLCNLYGETALHIAVRENLTEVVRNLLEYKYSKKIYDRYKFDPNQKNDADQTPLQIAVSSKDINPEIVNILIRNGATDRMVPITQNSFVNYKVLDEITKYNSLKDYMLYLTKHPLISFNEHDTAFFSHKDFIYNSKETSMADKDHPFIIALKMENTVAIEWMIKQGMKIDFLVEKYNNCLLLAIDHFEHHKTNSTQNKRSRQIIIDLIVKAEPKLLHQPNEAGMCALDYYDLIKPSLFSSKGPNYLSPYLSVEKKPEPSEELIPKEKVSQEEISTLDMIKKSDESENLTLDSCANELDLISRSITEPTAETLLTLMETRIKTDYKIPTDSSGKNALHLAVEKNFKIMVNTLLKYQPEDKDDKLYNLLDTDDFGKNVFNILVDQQPLDTEMFDILFKHGVKNDLSISYIEALGRENPTMCEELEKYKSFNHYLEYLKKHNKLFDKQLIVYFKDKTSINHKENLINAMKMGNLEAVNYLLNEEKTNLTIKFKNNNNYLHAILQYYYTNKATDKNEEINRQKIIHALVDANPALLKEANSKSKTPFDLFSQNKTLLHNPGPDFLNDYKSILTYLNYRLANTATKEIENFAILKNLKNTLLQNNEKLNALKILIKLNWFTTFNFILSQKSDNISDEIKIALFNKLLDETPIKYRFLETLCESKVFNSRELIGPIGGLILKMINKKDAKLTSIIEPYITPDLICIYDLGVETLKNNLLFKSNIDKFYDNYQLIHYSQMNVEYFKLLIDAGANVNGYTLDNSRTPLHCLVARLLEAPQHQANTLACIELLIKHGASLTLKDRRQQTPYDLLEDTSISQQIKDLLRPKQENLDSKPLTRHTETKPHSKMQPTTLFYSSPHTNIIDSKKLPTKDLSEEKVILPKLDTYTVSPMSISEQIIRHSSIYFSPTPQDLLAFEVDKSTLPCTIDALLLIQVQFDQFKKTLSELKLNLSSSYPSIKSNLFEVTSTDIETMQSICDVAKLYAHRQLSELIHSATAVRLVRPGCEVVDCLPTQVANIFLDELRINHDPYIHLYDANLLLSEAKEIIDESEKLKNYKRALNCFSIAAKNILKDGTLSNAQDFSMKLKEYGIIPADKNNYTYIYELLDVLKSAGLDTAQVKQDFLILDTQLALNHEAAISQTRLSFGSK